MPPTPGAHRFFDSIYLPMCANGVSKLLVFSDKLTKLVVLGPIKKTGATDAASAFVEHVFCWFGVPHSSVSDRGPHFASAVFHEICGL